jgi:hypothetical protein
MNQIYSQYLKLSKNRPSQSDIYYFVDIPKVKYHKLGITENGCPIFFIKCDNKDKKKYPSYNLGIDVDFGEDCNIANGNKKIIGKYTLITLKENSENLLPYFLDIVLIVVKSIPPNSSLKLVKSEIDKLVEMFSNMLGKGTGDIQGLWAELLIIELSKNPEYLVSSWHVVKTSLFDFNNGEDKLEIKSTKNNERKHTFSLNQLIPNKSSNLIIGSVLVAITGQGKNVFDLIDSIETRVQDKNLIFKLQRIIFETLGKNINEAHNIYFDYNSAKDSVAFFDINDIPKLNTSSIPLEISNIHFDCSLNNLKNANLKTYKSKLYKVL